MITTKPILMNAPMVRALISGRKTQTRRIMKPQLPDFVTSILCYPSNKRDWWPPHPHTSEPWLKYERTCPYGRPGDLLWVRETWAEVGNLDPGYLVYRATYPHCLPAELENVPADIRDAGERWRPSIHMPRWASRLTLRITDVRVHRLQEISENDALAEGLKALSKDGLLIKYGIPDCDGLPGEDDHGWHWQDWHPNSRTAFRRLWTLINGPGAWDANPWVWAISFDVIRANIDQVVREAV